MLSFSINHHTPYQPFIHAFDKMGGEVNNQNFNEETSAHMLHTIQTKQQMVVRATKPPF
jgi:hypothetical protein